MPSQTLTDEEMGVGALTDAEMGVEVSPYAADDIPLPTSPEELAARNLLERRASGFPKEGDLPQTDYTLSGGAKLEFPKDQPFSFPRITPPAEAGTVEKIASGAYNVLSSIPNFMLTREGLVTSAVGGEFAPVVKGVFGGLMAKGAGELAGKASVTGDPQDWTEAALSAAGAGLATFPGSLPPRPGPWQGPLAEGDVLNMPEGAVPPPRPPRGGLPRAEVPGTPAESRAVPTPEQEALIEDQQLIKTVRAFNARTKAEIQKLFPDMNRQQAAQLRDRVWGKEEEPPEAPAAQAPETEPPIQPSPVAPAGRACGGACAGCARDFPRNSRCPGKEGGNDTGAAGSGSRSCR
jgi:hypothetical protein